MTFSSHRQALALVLWSALAAPAVGWAGLGQPQGLVLRQHQMAAFKALLLLHHRLGAAHRVIGERADGRVVTGGTIQQCQTGRLKKVLLGFAPAYLKSRLGGDGT